MSTQLENPLVDLLRVAMNPGAVGGEAALTELLTRLHRPIYRFGLRRLRWIADADDFAADLAQETLIRVARSIESCRATTDGQLMAWMLAVARRTLIDMYRSPSSGLFMQQLTEELLGVQIEVGVEESAGRRTVGDPAYELLLRIAVQVAGETAPDGAELLWHRLVVGAEWAQIADALRTTEAGAKRRYQRLQVYLRKRVTRRIKELQPEERKLLEPVMLRLDIAG